MFGKKSNYIGLVIKSSVASVEENLTCEEVSSQRPFHTIPIRVRKDVTHGTATQYVLRVCDKRGHHKRIAQKEERAQAHICSNVPDAKETKMARHKPGKAETVVADKINRSFFTRLGTCKVADISVKALVRL